MNKNSHELEIILLGTYCNIVLEILKNNKNLSVLKVMAFSYLTKKNKYMHSNVYNYSNKNDVVLKSLSMFSGLFDDYIDNTKYIIGAIHLLIKNKKIVEHEGELIYIETNELFIQEKTFINLAIMESKKYSDEQFLKELVRNV
ncbi:hypothetical protein [Planococcus sp. YIM B11945]|uniref:hypothetical protein n=1 Tax=Planococcus sp. YIM B11945 TaxID=3435410 RepID=UPI003D7DA8FA